MSRGRDITEEQPPVPGGTTAIRRDAEGRLGYVTEDRAPGPPSQPTIKLWHCAMGNHASMRVWMVEYENKTVQMCGDCIEEAARRGHMVDATELGSRVKNYLPGQGYSE